MEDEVDNGGPCLLIVADDWGYSRRYNEGILEAAQAGAIDGAGAMVLREACAADGLLESRVAVGLHLEIGEGAGRGEAGRQAAIFEDLFDRPPAYIDGHHHRHADPDVESEVIALARDLGVRVRGVDAAQRERLRAAGVACAQRLVGRIDEMASVLPPELESVVRGDGAPPPGLTEWMVHPGRRDPGAGSSFDAGREEDLALLLELQATEVLAPLRERAARRGLR